MSWSTRLAAQSRERLARAVRRGARVPGFLPRATPIDVIERMQIGSRSIWECADAGAGVLAIRSTPWVFAWSQARYFLPGWYGAGAALQAAIAAGELAAVARRLRATGRSSRW